MLSVSSSRQCYCEPGAWSEGQVGNELDSFETWRLITRAGTGVSVYTGEVRCRNRTLHSQEILEVLRF